MNRYMYLERIMQRTPIRAKNGEYQWKINGKSYPIPEYAERMLIYAAYIGITGCTFFDLARKHLPKRALTNTDPELLKKTFLEDHHLIELIEYDRSIIPQCASFGNGMLVHEKKGDFGLYVDSYDEKRILSLIETSKMPFAESVNVIREIARRYSVTLGDEEFAKAAEKFFMMHGIDYDKLRKKENEYLRKRIEMTKKEIENTKEYASSEWNRQHPGGTSSNSGNEGWTTAAFVIGLLFEAILLADLFCGGEDALLIIDTPLWMAVTLALPDVNPGLYLTTFIVYEVFSIVIMIIGLGGESDLCFKLSVIGFLGIFAVPSVISLLRRPLF